MVKYASTYTKDTLKKRSAKDLSNDAYEMCLCFSSLFKSICCGYPFELQGLVDAIQMSIHKIGLHKETDKKYTDCNVKTTELLNSALCA